MDGLSSTFPVCFRYLKKDFILASLRAVVFEERAFSNSFAKK